uniref:Laccase n=1 Tax=Glycine max TaxID=3847 RepID=A0A0R0GXY9_SOYBN
MIGVLIIHVPPCSHPIDVPRAKASLASLIWTFPELVLPAISNHGRVTRHYQFDVRISIALHHLHAVPHKEHDYCKRDVGDRLVVKVNHVPKNITIHWHGVRQVRSGWSDGPSYITKCPIQSGQSYVYNLSMVGQKRNSILARTPLVVKGSSAWTPHTFSLKVKAGKSYLLRLINAAVNTGLFFSIANHIITVFEADATYIKPFDSDIILIGQGQTTNRGHFSLARAPSNNSTLAGILEYDDDNDTPASNRPMLKPTLPDINDTSFVSNLNTKFRSLNSAKHPANVPETVDKSFFFTIGLGSMLCPRNQTCEGPNNRTKFSASMNNISFPLPSVAILEKHFSGQEQDNNGVYYTTDFPVVSLRAFNYTGTPPNNTMVKSGTKVVVIPFNTRVQVVLQDTRCRESSVTSSWVQHVSLGTGWVAIRFLADDPGVWLMHCHIDVHLSWGTKLPPPPADLPKC